jgi:hypothetical protein
MSHWDGSGNPYDWNAHPRRRLHVPVLFGVVVLLLTVGIGYGVIRLTRDDTPTDSLPAGDAAPVLPGSADSSGPAPGGSAPAGGAPGGQAGTPPADGVLLAKCRAGDGPADGAKAQAARVRVVFADQAGYLVWIGTTGFDRLCAYRWDGGRDDRQVGGLAGSTASTDYINGSGGLVSLAASSEDRGSDQIMTIEGVVSRDVRRVDVRWAGRPATRAAVHEQFFLARRIEPTAAGASPPLDEGCLLEAYNAQGQPIGNHRC